MTPYYVAVQICGRGEGICQRINAKGCFYSPICSDSRILKYLKVNDKMLVWVLCIWPNFRKLVISLIYVTLVQKQPRTAIKCRPLAGHVVNTTAWRANSFRNFSLLRYFVSRFVVYVLNCIECCCVRNSYVCFKTVLKHYTIVCTRPWTIFINCLSIFMTI